MDTTMLNIDWSWNNHPGMLGTDMVELRNLVQISTFKLSSSLGDTDAVHNSLLCCTWLSNFQALNLVSQRHDVLSRGDFLHIVPFPTSADISCSWKTIQNKKEDSDLWFSLKGILWVRVHVFIDKLWPNSVAFTHSFVCSNCDPLIYRFHKSITRDSIFQESLFFYACLSLQIKFF